MSVRQLALTVALVTVVALAAVVANLALLRSTQDSSDPVGRLSPRAVFSTTPATGNGQSTTPSGGSDRQHEGEPDD
jgi:hypothetical protein